MDMNLSKLWETEKPGVLQSMGSQTVGHDLATEQQRNYLFFKCLLIICYLFFKCLFFCRYTLQFWIGSCLNAVSPLLPIVRGAWGGQDRKGCVVGGGLCIRLILPSTGLCKRLVLWALPPPPLCLGIVFFYKADLTFISRDLGWEGRHVFILWLVSFQILF